MTCSWTPDKAHLNETYHGLDAALQEQALMLASSSLQMLTNYRVGLCPEKVRPCPGKRPCNHMWEPYFYERDGAWLNACGCSTARWCNPLYEIDLEGPVGYVSEIKVDGKPISLEGFRLDNGHLLVWEGPGVSPIPQIQDVGRPDTAIGTWSITYSKSHPVDAEGEIAVAHLANEFAKALDTKKSSKCKLPRGVTSVVRAGVSFSVEQGLFVGGLTGIDLVDQYILKWAPAGSPTRTATVFTPRSAPARRSGPLPGPPVRP